MPRSLFALLPLLAALLAAPVLAEEPPAGKEAAAPLWHRGTEDAGSAGAKQDPKRDTKQDPKQDPKQEAKQEAKQEPKQEPKDEAVRKDEAKEVGKELQYGTLEQYRACMDSEDRIKDLRKMLEEHIAQNNATMLEIKNQASSLLEMQRKLVMSDDAQVEAFNKRTEAHNKLVKSANESSDKLRAELEAFNTKSMDHNVSCASLIVKMSDRDAVIKERTPAVTK